MAEVPDDTGQQRQGVHHGDDDVDVAIDVGDDAAEEVAEQRHAAYPADAADDVEGDESPVLHLADPSHHRRERADDRHEAREDDRLAPVSLVEGLCPQQMGAAKEQGVVAREQPWPGARADVVAELIPHNRRERDRHQEGAQVEPTGAGKDPGGDEKRIAGQEEPDHQTGLREHDPDQRCEPAPAHDAFDVVDAVQQLPERSHPHPSLAPAHYAARAEPGQRSPGSPFPPPGEPDSVSAPSCTPSSTMSNASSRPCASGSPGHDRPWSPPRPRWSPSFSTCARACTTAAPRPKTVVPSCSSGIASRRSSNSSVPPSDRARSTRAHRTSPISASSNRGTATTSCSARRAGCSRISPSSIGATRRSRGFSIATVRAKNTRRRSPAA